MAPRTDVAARSALTRRRVLQAAVDLADREGLPALTMRRLAQDLDVEAMSLYHHVANKEAVLDGVVEVVVGEIVTAVAGVGPDPAEDWRAALRARILTARQVLLRHPWAPAVIETRTAMNAEIVGYFDGLLGILRAGGFSYDLAHHGMHALGSRALGFTRELFAPTDPEAGGAEATAMLEQLAGVYPHLAGMLADTVHQDDGVLGWCDDQAEFEFALDLLLDGLDRRLRAG
jgi:AcrR family transcriptional regulator